MRDLHTLKINPNVFSKHFIYSVDVFNRFPAARARVHVYERVDEGGGGEEADG